MTPEERLAQARDALLSVLDERSDAVRVRTGRLASGLVGGREGEDYVSRRTRFSCMHDDCEADTGGESRLYCKDHDRALKAPDRRRPETAELSERWDAKAFWENVRDARADE